MLQQVQYVWGGDVAIMWALFRLLCMLLFMLPEDTWLHMMWHISATITRESDHGSLHTAGQTWLVKRGANSRRAQAETFLSPCWTIAGCSYTFLLSNQSSALPHATHGVVAIYLHELTRSWLRRAVLTHKAEGFYVWHTLWWGVRLYLCVTVSSEL